MWLGVLGPLSVRHADGVLPVPAGKLRVLLAALLVHANDALSYDALGEALWDGEPPPGARATIRNYVKRLRQVLGPVVGARIVTRDPGYLIELANDELDLLRFTLLCKEGGAAVHTGAWPRASARLGAALALWRGAPLVDVPSEVLQRDEVPRLEQIRLQAAEWRIDADLHLGRHAQVVTELQAMASAQPLREGVHRQLMLALAGCGRRAEALDTYRQAATYSSTNSASNQAPNCGSCTSASWPATRRLVAASTPGDSARPIVVGQRAPARPPCPAPPDFAVAVRRRQRSRAGVGIVAAVLAAATTVAAVITNDPAPGPSAVYSRCPIGSFCLFNGKDGSTNYCTWVMSDPVADRDCNWLGLGWTTRSVFNRMSVPVQYCAQEQYKSCVGRTAPGRWGNLAATYTVRSVKAE